MLSQHSHDYSANRNRSGLKIVQIFPHSETDPSSARLEEPDSSGSDWSRPKARFQRPPVCLIRLSPARTCQDLAVSAGGRSLQRPGYLGLVWLFHLLPTREKKSSRAGPGWIWCTWKLFTGLKVSRLDEASFL